MRIRTSSLAAFAFAGIWTLFGSLAIAPCLAADLRVTVLDPNGKAVSNIVVVATPPILPTSLENNAQAVMDQVDKTFVPEILAVRKGTAVIFPNSDSVAHQVYSFSAAKRFALPLYRGRPYPPVVFDRPGVVTLGCNIHDRMVGYIFVTDSPYFGKTNAQGIVEWHSLSAATYRVDIWSPHLAAAEPDRAITTSESNAAELVIRLARQPHAAPAQPTDRRIREY